MLRTLIIVLIAGQVKTRSKSGQAKSTLRSGEVNESLSKRLCIAVLDMISSRHPRALVWQ